MRAFTHSMVWAVVAAAFTVGGSIAQETEPVKHTEDSIETVKEKLADGTAVILDVRELAEWDAGHLKVAKFVPLSMLRELEPEVREIEGVAKDKVVYVHCRSGKRSLTAAPFLTALGYQVRPLLWGYEALVEKGLEPAVIVR